MSAEDVRQSRSPLRRLGWVVLVAALLSLLLLPLPSASKVWILVVVAFAGVFTLLEARAQGKALAAIMAALLALYLGLSLQRAWILLSSDVLVSKLLAIGMILLPVLGVWALVREVVFGSRLEGLGRRLEAEGGLPEDLRLGLAYSASGDTARARRCMRDAVALSRGRAPRGPASTGD